jgi:hypothetical protein
MYEKIIARAYLRELLGALAIYTALLVPTIVYGRRLDDGVLKILVLASPMIGFGLAVWAIARHLRRVDEFMRQYTLETVAMAAAITAGITFTYGFLETAGYPRLSMFAVWPIMGGAWITVSVVRMLARR